MANTPFEILAPAGDETMLRAAVFSGADCVYLGVEGLNARRTATNFAGETLAKAVAFCHARGCGVHAALNTTVLPGEEDKVTRALLDVAAAGCDAIIVQDFAVAQLAKQLVPSLPLHASTQSSVHSLAGVLEMAELGFSRVILSRELSAEEIAAIAAKSPIELEVFVHGALCVSVSGQCYMSAFLGGRSANRGACAGPCRLPFCAVPAGQGQPYAPLANLPAHHLSLKDLSVLNALPALRDMGVVSAKIEGRLRGPEYCAVVVDSARKILAGQPYDAALLQAVFSRSGFTDGWFTGRGAGEMFGTRTEADTAAAKATLPKARELYRREMPRVPVQMKLALAPEGAELTITDDKFTVQATLPGPLAPAQQNTADTLRGTLAKTGGTPFAANNIEIETNGLFLPATMAGALRRQLLEELLVKREVPVPLPVKQLAPTAQWLLFKAVDALPSRPMPTDSKPRFCARFEHVAQLPTEATRLPELVLPLFEAEKVPQELREKTWLWLPRVLFGKQEERARAAIEKTKTMGFKGYETQNVAHWQLCRGLPMRGGFGLNITNPIAAAQGIAAGCQILTLSPELTLRQMQAILQTPSLAGKAGFSMLGYGKMPLMLTRACPLKNVTTCAACQKQGTLTDRKGKKMPVLCRDDVRTILNPVPLWMADRLCEVPTGEITLYFTDETPAQVAEVLAGFLSRQKPGGNFTRGLYYQGLEG